MFAQHPRCRYSKSGLPSRGTGRRFASYRRSRPTLSLTSSCGPSGGSCVDTNAPQRPDPRTSAAKQNPRSVLRPDRLSILRGAPHRDGFAAALRGEDKDVMRRHASPRWPGVDNEPSVGRQAGTVAQLVPAIWRFHDAKRSVGNGASSRSGPVPSSESSKDQEPLPIRPPACRKTSNRVSSLR